MEETMLNPWRTIWFRPRATLQNLLDNNPTYMVLPLATVGGIGNALSRATESSAGSDLSLGAILILTLVLGAATGLIGLYLSGWLLAAIGRWFGGRANAARMRTALAWSSLPSVVSIIPWILLLLIMGPALLTPDATLEMASRAESGLLKTVAVVQLLLGLWSMVLMVICISQVQGFGIGKSLLNLLLPFFLIIIVVGMISGMIHGG